jgi:hypothetical protein
VVACCCSCLLLVLPAAAPATLTEARVAHAAAVRREKMARTQEEKGAGVVVTAL